MKRMTHSFLPFLMMCFLGNLYAANVNGWKLSPEGLGPIQIGMTLKQAEKAGGIPFSSTKPDTDQAEDDSCYYVSLKDVSGVSFMMSHNKIVRINVNSPTFKTSKGAKIGDSEIQVQALYGGKLLVEPHHYDEQGFYLTLSDTKKDRGIRFETNGKVITLMYSGKDNEIHFVEGCL